MVAGRDGKLIQSRTSRLNRKSLSRFETKIFLDSVWDTNVVRLQNM